MAVVAPPFNDAFTVEPIEFTEPLPTPANENVKPEPVDTEPTMPRASTSTTASASASSEIVPPVSVEPVACAVVSFSTLLSATAAPPRC